MSFSYTPLNANGLPSVLPLLANLSNGGGYLPSISTSQANLLAIHQSGSAENNLEYSRSAVASKLCQFTGARQIELDSLNDELESYIPNATNNDLRLANAAANMRRIGNDLRSDENSEKNFATLNSIYNMGLSSSNLLMMPGVMNMLRDPSSMNPSMPPQYALLNHQLSAHSPSTSTNKMPDIETSPSTSTNSSASIAKETITCNSCILLPPNPSAPAPTTRERPKGCRTVFVGGLPENIAEETIREVFDRCGEITTLRLSKKNFCHIRFVFEASVDSAIYLSGYRIRINNQADAPNCGRLHVDFAQARDDQYDFECKQRQLQREQRHRDRVERDRLRPSSPPPIVHFSEHEAAAIAEKLKQDEFFPKACQTLITWLDRGDCNKKNSNTFYSMIQSTNPHIRRLLNEKSTYEEELNKAKESYRKQMQCLSTQLTQIDKVFGAASHKKVWDHFSKAQRKNIDLWKKQSMDVQVPQESLESHDTDEMEMSDDDNASANQRYGKRPRSDSKTAVDEETDLKTQQLKVLQETIRNLQTQLLENKAKENENLMKIDDLEDKLKRSNVKELLLNSKTIGASEESIASDNESSDSDKDVVLIETPIQSKTKLDSNRNIVDQDFQVVGIDEVRLAALISSYLMVYPYGASLENITQYVDEASTGSDIDDIRHILQRHSNIFTQISCDDTATANDITRKWKFCGFHR